MRAMDQFSFQAEGKKLAFTYSLSQSYPLAGSEHTGTGVEQQSQGLPDSQWKHRVSSLSEDLVYDLI